jgi:hypothetical protein
MSRHRELPPLRVRPGVSLRLAAYLSAVHALALAAVLLLPLGGAPRAALAAAVLAGLAAGLAGPVLHRTPWTLREALWQADGTWSLKLASGRTLEGKLLPSTYVGQWLVLLAFRCGRVRTCCLPLLADNLDADVLRRLRVRLRLAAERRSPGPGA